MSQVDLDEAIARASGVALVPDWLAARALRAGAVRLVDSETMGVSLPRHVAVEGLDQNEIRAAAGLTGRKRPMPAPGQAEWHAAPDDPCKPEPDEDEDDDGE